VQSSSPQKRQAAKHNTLCMGNTIIRANRPKRSQATTAHLLPYLLYSTARSPRYCCQGINQPHACPTPLAA
jgi:hypothetical protein